jgi:hypothetical protein
MDVARDDRAQNVFQTLLAGLQAGMLAALWMLAWMGVSAAWQRSSFWTSENLLASTFYGSRAIHSGFAFSTLSGLALYLTVYSLLGCLFAVAVQTRLPRLRLLLVSVAAAVVWYYLSFDIIWKALSPLVTLLHAERSTVLGHVIYGVVLARFPRYLPPAAAAAAIYTAEAVAVGQGGETPSESSNPIH